MKREEKPIAQDILVNHCGLLLIIYFSQLEYKFRRIKNRNI